MNRRESTHSPPSDHHSPRRRPSLIFAGLVAVVVLVSLFLLMKGSDSRTPEFNPPPDMQRRVRPELASPPPQRPQVERPDLPFTTGARAGASPDMVLTVPREFREPRLSSRPDRAIRPRGDTGGDWRDAYTPQVEPVKPPVARASLTELRPYQEWNVHETATDSLARIGEAAVPALIRGLGDAEPKRRAEAAWLLGHIGPGAKPAVPALVAALEDPSPEVQKSAARALGQIGPDAAQAVEPLMRLVEETEAVGISNAPANP